MNGPVRTHYDNLKVARNAPPEVIKAAYKTLAQKYHPDLNPGSEAAARIMVMLNQAYAVLSDPLRRKDHDAWIAEQEQEAAQRTTTSDGYSSEARSTAESMRSAYGADIPFSQTNSARGNASAQTRQAQPPAPVVQRNSDNPAWLQGLFLLCVLVVWNWDTVKSWFEKPQTVVAISTPAPVAAVAKPPIPARPVYQRPTVAPSGYAWPVSAGYVDGFPLLNQSGRSTFTIDNSRGNGDVFVKLHSVAGRNAGENVRHLFIPFGSRFTARNLTTGWYEVRYRTLTDGSLHVSEAFEAKETVVDDSMFFSNLTLTLYTVPGGNTKTKTLAEADF